MRYTPGLAGMVAIAASITATPLGDFCGSASVGSMVRIIPRLARIGGEGSWVTRSRPGGWEAVQIGNAAFDGSNRTRFLLYQWVSGSSTKTVDNPVEKVFDSRVKVAVSLAFLRID